MKTARERIVEYLTIVKAPVALHEFFIYGSSQTAISARLREMAREGLVIGKIRKNRNFKEWTLTPPVAQELPGGDSLGEKCL